MLCICDETFFGFSVIIFHLYQFETFLSSIQLNHMHSDFILDIENTFIKMKKKVVQTDLKRKHFKHQYK